jgi:iron complex outermembrane receptor protein
VAQLGESVRVHTFVPPASLLVDDPVDLNGANVTAAWRRNSAPGSFWTVQAYVDHTYRLGTDFGERRTTVDVDALHQWSVSSRHTLAWGLGARTSPSRIIQTYAFSDFAPHAHTLNMFSAFAQDTFTVVPRRLTVSAGLKFEHHTYSGLDVQPSARVLWTPSATQSLWGGLTRAVRTPSRVDRDITVRLLARPEPLTYAVITGNPRLGPEGVVGIEGGYRALVQSRLYVDVAVFRNRYADLVDLGPPTSATATTEGVSYNAITFPWINGNEGTTRGFEVSPDWRPVDWFRLRGSYSRLRIDLRPNGDNLRPVTLVALQGSTPRHLITVQSLMTLPGGVQLDPVYRYVSSRRGPDVPSYHEADIRLDVPLNRRLQFSLVGQNLLHAHHIEWARDPGPSVGIRRSLYARLTWRR